MRRPSPTTLALAALTLSAAALVVAIAPVSEAAVGWVRHALFAKNAGAVNGFAASRRPRPGKLLVLPASGKLPAAILPDSIGGPAGPRGPQGPPGTDGSGGSASTPAYEASVAGPVTLGGTAITVVSIALPTGTYALTAKASLQVTSGTSTPAVACDLTAGSDSDSVDLDMSAIDAAPVALVAAHTFASAGTATLTCMSSDAGVAATDAHIVALRASSLTAS